MYTQGSGQGMEPLSWRTIKHVISNLKRLAIWLQKYKIASFDELQELPELKLRNIILSLVQSVNLQKHPSFAQSLLYATYWLKTYALVTNDYFYILMNEYLTPFTLLKKERRNKHAIIPTRIMKQVLIDSEEHVECAEKAFEHWLPLQQSINQAIPYCHPSEFTNGINLKVLNDTKNKELNKYHQAIKDLRRYVYILVLGYTGMRHSEAMVLADDAAIEKSGKYYIKTLLSKTTDNTQCLEWITNHITYRSVVLLGKVNCLYRERAALLLDHHTPFLQANKKLNLEFGLSECSIFGVSPSKKSCGFSSHAKSIKTGFNNINHMFSIAVTDDDIAELERMGCNYQSVGSNHKKFKQPYSVGDFFNFTAHQFRHTFAWFIIANRLGDLDDIKYQYKHLDNMMSLVYSQRGYESMEELIRLTESFSEFMISQTMEEMVTAAEDGTLAGKGGQNFISRLADILNDDITTGSTPHFSNMQELIAFAAKHTSNFRGLSHGYCTKGDECKVRNAADPSHCVYCESYIATPRHLPHWLVIKKRCESQLASFENFPADLKKRFMSFSHALKDNLEAANTIIQQLTISVKEIEDA